jgi:3-dehydroquinate synthase
VGALIVDETVLGLHGAALRDAIEPGTPIMTVPAGERAKSLVEVEHLWQQYLDIGLDRQARVLAVGGGATTDVAGFAAAGWMRGIRWVAMPTTLLGMVDAAIGGKTGVDFGGAKNLIGAFHHPDAVIVVPDFLRTLPEREIRSGLAEVIKVGVVGDDGLFAALERTPRPRTPDEFPPLIEAAVRVKAAVVSDDEREAGRRAVLNFGHTVGHAVEAAAGFDRWLHGEAVAIGMAVAAELSHEHMGLPSDDAGRIRDLLVAAGLPVCDPELQPESVERWLIADKKSRNGRPRFVLTPRLGSASVGHEIPQQVLQQSLARFFGERARGEATR